MSNHDADAIETIRLVTHRADFLQCLSTSPHDKRDLVEELGYSRSTVDRAVRDLEMQGLVKRVGGAYTTTLSGRVSLEQYQQFVETTTEALETQDLVDELPPDAPIDGQLLCSASAHYANDTTPYTPVEQLIDRLDGADRLCVLAASVPNPRFVDHVLDWSRTDGLTTEFVFSEPVLETLRHDDCDMLDSLAAAGTTLSVGDVPPFDVHLVGDGDETVVQVVVRSDTGSVLGVVSNDTPEAVRWATSQVSAVRDTAKSVTVDATATDETVADSTTEDD